MMNKPSKQLYVVSWNDGVLGWQIKIYFVYKDAVRYYSSIKDSIPCRIYLKIMIPSDGNYYINYETVKESDTLPKPTRNLRQDEITN